MIQTVEAIVDERGAVRLLEPLHLDRRHRALVTILADEPPDAHETELLSEASLAVDWNRSEEDAAWSHLVASSDAFTFLADPAEDIYSAADGEPVA